MAARALGGDIGAEDVDREIGVHSRYARLANCVANDDALSSRDEHTEVRVRLEPRARATDLDAVPLAVRRASRTFVAPGAVVANADGSVIPAPQPWVHDALRRVDHAQRLTTAEAPLLDSELSGVAPTTRDLDHDIGAVSGFDAELAGEIVDGDDVARERAALRLCGDLRVVERDCE